MLRIGLYLIFKFKSLEGAYKLLIAKREVDLFYACAFFISLRRTSIFFVKRANIRESFRD